MRLFECLSLLALLSTKVSAGYLDDWDVRSDTIRTSNYGPLTTQFSPPASCFTPYTQIKYGVPYSVQGCEGPNGNECCPEGWRIDVYYSPGMCPSGYRQCTLPTSRQRPVTTNVCCPSGFDCNGQDLCTRPYNTEAVLTHTDATTSVERTIYGITATPIQIRFQASDSTVVPVPTESFDLPKEGDLTTRQKVGIGIGVPIAVACLSFVVFCCYRHHPRFKPRRRKPRPQFESDIAPSMDGLPSDPPPAYPGAPSSR